METTGCRIESDELISSLEALPPLPQATSRIIRILADPLFEISELIRTVALDPSLTASLLRLANSATYSVGRPVSNVGEAVVRLGSGTVLAMSLATVARPRPTADFSPFGLTAETYWMHCIGAVAAAEELSMLRIANFGPGFSTAALLHDFGKQVLLNLLTPDRLQVMTEYRRTHPGHPAIDCERETLGTDHASVGATVLRSWMLADEITTAIQRHHEASDWSDDLTHGVILANQVSHELDHTDNDFLAESELVADALITLGIHDVAFEETVRKTRKRFLQLLDLFRG